MPRRSSRLVQPEDLLRLVTVADPRFSADGHSVVFVRKGYDAKGARTSELWLASTRGAQRQRPLTTGPRDSTPRPSPVDDSLLFVRSATKEAPQLALLKLPPVRGKARPQVRTLTRLPEGSLASVEWSPDGRHVAFKWRQTMTEFTAAAAKRRKALGHSTPALVVDDPWYRLDGDGVFGTARFRLFVLDLGRNGAAPREVFRCDHLDDFSFDWSPDSSTIAVACNRDPRALFHPERAEILLVDPAGKRSPRSIEGLPEGPKDSPRWSPDGTHLAWAGRRGRSSMYDTANVELWTAAIDGSASRPRAVRPTSLTGASDFCLMSGTLSDTADASFAPWFAWSPDGQSLLMRIGWHGAGRIASVSASGGEVVLHTDGGAELAPGAFAAREGLIVAVRSAPMEPPEIAVAEVHGHLFEVEVRTSFNSSFRQSRALVTPREVWVTADGRIRSGAPRSKGRRSGHAVHAWVMRPPPGAPRRGGAAILQVHGGPHAQYGVSFFHEFQVLAAAGYTVVFSNPRGSKGYGARFCGAIRGRWGTADWKDVQSVTRFMARLPGVNRARLAIMGGSYGGYMANWAIAHSKEYRAAITDRCVSDLSSMCGTSDYPEVPDLYWPGVAWDRPQALRRSSPITCFKGVRTPTLIIHSEGDLRCNIEQGEQVHAALVTQGVPTRFVRYPRETSHGMSRSGPSDLRIHRLRQILQWWDEHLVKSSTR
ncbi:MAG: S9 family peptidase [Phycisphaeraceae bacterium]|nr:S9 family peptidase [Phycisphaeraceae bacterium]